MARRSKIIFCLLLAFVYVVVNIYPLRAEALPDVMSGSTTLADNILTYYALSGSAVANSDWINTLYESFGSSFGTIEELADQGYLVLNDAGMWEPVQALGQMIEQTPAYSSLGLNDIFNVSAQEAAQTGAYAAASGGSILAGSLGGVASTGVVPLLGGVTAAYWGGIALGTLINHIVDKYKRNIYNGNPITNQQFLSMIPDGNAFILMNISSNQRFGWYTVGARGFVLDSSVSTDQMCWYKNGHNGSINVVQKNLSNNTTRNQTVNIIDGIGTSSVSLNEPKYYFPVIQTNLSTTDYLNAVRNGSVVPKFYSPDMIGEDGNLSGKEQNGNITVPDMKPQIDPGTQAGKPLTLPDWLAFANAVSNNNNNTAPSGSPDNASLFDNILDLIRTVIPEQNPDPDPNPDPWSPPVVTPVPDPSYPDPVPDQQITENPQESENPQETEPLDPSDTGKPWKLPDLRQKFPFCIPWDIAKVFSKLKVNARQAPHISWRFNPPNTPIDYTFNLDLEDFEDVAALLRTLELMGFIVGLAFVTRYLIGAN